MTVLGVVIPYVTIKLCESSPSQPYAGPITIWVNTVESGYADVGGFRSGNRKWNFPTGGHRGSDSKHGSRTARHVRSYERPRCRLIRVFIWREEGEI